MNKLDVVRKAKSFFMKWRLHNLVALFREGLPNLVYMSGLSKWKKETTLKGYNDWYQRKWNYNRREDLYRALIGQENVGSLPKDYREFGVANGLSFKWWLQHNKNPESRFHGFNTFEGLSEDFGPFAKGSIAAPVESLNIMDERAHFHKGLFQETLVPFLEQYRGGRKKLIHMDADIFSATIFTLSQLYRHLSEGDIIFFDEFAVPKHEFRAFAISTESFYVKYDVIAAANNYLFLTAK